MPGTPSRRRGALGVRGGVWLTTQRVVTDELAEVRGRPRQFQRPYRGFGALTRAMECCWVGFVQASEVITAVVWKDLATSDRMRAVLLPRQGREHANRVTPRRS